MTSIDNLNTKPVQQILMEVRERFSNRANWQTNSLSNRHGCMCLLGGLSVAEGIITVDDYKSHYEMGCLTVGEFPNQAAIYRALGKSRALEFLMKDIATDNDNIAMTIRANKDGMHFVDAAWTYNDGHDRGSDRDKEISYTRLMNSLDRAIANVSHQVMMNAINEGPHNHA